MSLLESLQWRYAAKRMTGEKLPQEKVDVVLEAARLAPTSSGIQPFSILQITDRQLLEKIKPIAFNQPQITEASHLLVFAAWTPGSAGERSSQRNAPGARLSGHG